MTAELLAAALLGFFAVGYFVLGGADIGLGMVLPYLGRDPGQRRTAIAAVGPVFLGNEVWLVATAGLLVGAFPDLEGELLTGLFPAVVALLAGWIGRDAGLWMRGRAGGRAWWAVCDTAITAGSWTVALSWGWMFSGLFAGITDRPATGLGAALAALAVAVLFGSHGLAFAALRLSGPLRTRARGPFGPSGEAPTFALTSAAMALLPLAAGIRLPLAATAADDGTLAFLLPVVAIILPLLLAAQVWTWSVFRHRVTGPGYL
ncbi:cytochrome d ubiquinol oxidase subunit II [Allonocardiopsis opalescens]|uniref:Cytochrome bd-type quinol oxidase subunit 2 n=1 Tax=Allonocardiopsis opalescens TaxID=1144618 RepID=A0A2T0Q7M4_9ACTN|nr:cytochrome d ubiquinol oxidase subunit II [Allonocardiopsis opalescens]PRX99792.1 cytochrome bd-type quinol oxidase subunit 2 [Allonocardiopsis opalescens]